MDGGKPNAPFPGMIANLGEPIRLLNVTLLGVAADSSRPGEQCSVYTRLALTSDDANFHRFAEGIGESLNKYVQQAHAHVDIFRANSIVLIVRPDKQGELWVDTAATSLKTVLKRPVAPISAVFENNVADILGMWFPAIDISPTDRMLVLFRRHWGFGLFFDLDPEKDMDVGRAERELGRLYRRLQYRQLYEVVANAQVFDQVVSSGWFPFVELLGDEFEALVSHCTAGFPMEEFEARLGASFDDARLDHMVARWQAKPQLQPKMALLNEAVRHFKAREPIAAIKIAITEIEGVLRAFAPIPKSGERPCIKDLLAHAIDTAIKRSGSGDTLLLPDSFSKYLSQYTFAQFDPSQGVTGQAGSRHAVGHGAAVVESYTDAKALQVLLTIDQIAFYT